MNLFDSIGLSADPFSTSPNVELFYPAVEHRQCLEGLELAIRMRRGLSVVRGGIGVGKTTISRKLIQNFKDESDDFDFYLILDPKFESEIILLKHIIELFGINESGESVQDCRNIIENYLLKVGVEQGKTLVLIIDEGQNLPGEMLDVFRTLLNFETDDFKLLQLIIFGQPEMGAMIHKYPNFEDRISFDFEIGPIALEDMKGMIDHRIEVTGGKAGSWFTEKAILKIHKNTQGYPRKVTQLCHQILLTMISEDKNDINEEMVQRVISGKIDIGGLLKQKKKNYNEIAVNKLLDVLRKEEPEKEDQTTEPIFDPAEENDWIGGSSEELPVDKLESKKENKVTPNDPIKTITTPENKNIQVPIASSSEANGDGSLPPTQTDFSDDDFLPTQGRYPPHINSGILNNIPIDQTYIGLHVDCGRISATVIQEKNGIKTLLSHEIFSNNDRFFSPIKNPQDFIEACSESIDLLVEKIQDYGDLYKSASKSVEKKNTIVFTLNHDQIKYQLVSVPKENKKEKQEIIQWAINKNYNYTDEDSIVVNHVAGKKNLYRVGIGEKSVLENISDPMYELGWGIRQWYPIHQALYNAFIWNYPEHRKKNTIIIFIGENSGNILGCTKTELTIIRELYIGVQSLTDALRDNGISIDTWHDRKLFQVPESFLRSMGQKVNKGTYDDIFRPVFDSWRQEIDRTINSMRKEFKISDDTEILLSGSAGEILYLDKFIEGSTGLDTSFINPIRNLALPVGFELSSLDYHPSLLAASIGSALHIKNSVNIVPKKLKQNEILRWINRAGLVSTAASIIIFCGLSLFAKLNINALNIEINPMQIQNESLAYVEKEHSLLSENKTTVEEQLNILSYDTEYFNRILAINRFLSFYTPKEIRINELNFQEGWEIQAYKKVGRDLVKVVRKEDEHQRVVRLAGKVQANPALLNSHFNNFLAMLDESGLFQNIEVMSEASQAHLGNDNLQFEIKCVI